MSNIPCMLPTKPVCVWGGGIERQAGRVISTIFCNRMLNLIFAKSYFRVMFVDVKFD